MTGPGTALTTRPGTGPDLSWTDPTRKFPCRYVHARAFTPKWWEIGTHFFGGRLPRLKVFPRHNRVDY